MHAIANVASTCAIPELTLVLFLAGTTTATTSPGVQEETARRVETTLVERVDLERRIRLVGTLSAFETVVVKPRVSGYLSQISVEEGDTLAQGDSIATIAVPELEARRGAARAMVDEAAAGVEDAQAGVDKARAAVGVAESAVALKRAELNVCAADVRLHELAFQRVRGLHPKAATDEQLEEAEVQLDMARARGQAAQAAQQAAEAETAAAKAKLRAAEASVSSAEARVETTQREVERLEVRLGFAALTNPYPKGLVSRRHVDRGALVLEGMTSVVTVMDVSKLRLRVDIPEGDAPLVASGAPVTIALDAFPGRPVEAEVTRTSGALDTMTRTMRAEVELDNTNGKLLPGMFCHVSLAVERREKAMTLPGSAIYASGGAPHVMFIEGGKAKRAEVVLGIDDGLRAEIRSGLTGDERVILGRPSGLRDGDPVVAAGRGTGQ